MKQTLKITNALSDPTRFNIYQQIIQNHKAVTVLDVANNFEIHPNVARLHLTKLEEIDVINSSFQRTGKGGRPSKLYKLADEAIELNFPHRDYKLFSFIAIETFVELGEPGKQALYNMGEKYGHKIVERHRLPTSDDRPTIEYKIQILKDTGTMLGMYPTLEYNSENNSISLEVNNCPFKEIVSKNQSLVCSMHHAFLKGMFKELFTSVELIEENNMFQDCHNCSYIAELSIN